MRRAILATQIVWLRLHLEPPMKLSKINRRRFIFLGASLLAPCAVAADARWLELEWVKVRRLRLADGKPTHRFVHFTDLHHKGDQAHTRSVVEMINSLSPDFVCFTGDIMEEGKYLPEALEILSGVKSPIVRCAGQSRLLEPGAV